MSFRFKCPCCGATLMVEARKQRAKEEREARHLAIGEAYRQGLSATEVAGQFGVSRAQVCHIINKLGIEKRVEYRGRKPRTAPTESELSMIELYESGKTLKEVGYQFGITRERVRQILARRGQGTRSVKVARHLRKTKRDAVIVPQIIARFQAEGISAITLARSMGIDVKYVVATLTQAGLYKRRQPKKTALRRALANDSEMIRLYEQTDTPVAELAAMFGFKNEASCRLTLFRLGGRRRKPRADAA